MSAQKINQFLPAPKEEEQLRDHPPPVAITVTDDPSIPSLSLYTDQRATQGEPYELAQHPPRLCQEPGDTLALRATSFVCEPLSHNHDESTGRPSKVPIKWMSSKMRLRRKMMGSDQIIINQPRRKMQSSTQIGAVLNQEISSNGNISPSCIVRVCSDCNTTKTPLWRSGPHGPKSLCNACGIRQMKARRALMAATATSARREVTMKEKKSSVDRTVPYKKRYKFTNHGTDHFEKLSFKDPLIELSSSSSAAFHPSFPQDDKDAAVLLMTLSCGMIHGQVL